MALNLVKIKEFVSEENFEVADLHFAADGKHFLFVYKIESKYFAQYNEKLFEGFDSVEHVSFRKSGRVFIYKYSSFSKKLGLIKDENQDYLNIGGQVIGPFTKIRDFKFNENLSYYIWFENLGKTYLTINNQKFGSFRSISKVFISAEGTHYAFQYKEGSLNYIKTGRGDYDGL
jgi:hypothetical protein